MLFSLQKELSLYTHRMSMQTTQGKLILLDRYQQITEDNKIQLKLYLNGSVTGTSFLPGIHRLDHKLRDTLEVRLEMAIVKTLSSPEEPVRNTLSV